MEASHVVMAKEMQTSEKHALFYFCIQGIVCQEFMPPGQSRNPTFYCYVLRRFWEDICWKRLTQWKVNNFAVHHDKTPSHSLFITQSFLTKNLMTVVPNKL